MNELIDEILNSGIESEDTILHLGVGFKDGELLETLSSYWDIDAKDFLSNGSYIGVDVNPSITSKLNSKFKTDAFITDSFQNYLDVNPTDEVDWTILTGVFNNNDYENNQYDFLFETLKRCMETSQNGVVFTLNPYLSNGFSYSVVFIFTHLISTYSKVFAKKLSESSYIFTIIK